MIFKKLYTNSLNISKNLFKKLFSFSSVGKNWINNIIQISDIFIQSTHL